MIRCGQKEATPAWRRLRCGSIDVDFDPAGGWLRRAQVDGAEVVRAIYGAVRDCHWGTVPPRIHALSIVEADGGFRISFAAECVASAIDFRWRGEIAGEASGTLRFSFSGEAGIGFWRNRIGLCVLHPISGCAGERCRVETVDGMVTDEVFPDLIAPRQPFRNVRAITHVAGSGRSVEVRFAGEVFETEDQRNWTDASFKTYGTPLAEPFPVWIESGTRIEQTVTVRVHDSATRAPVTRRVKSEPIPELHLADKVARPQPLVGFGMASHGVALTPREAERLRRLRPAHLRVDLRLDESAWPARWRMAVADAVAVRAALHVAVFLSDNAARELAALATEVAAHPARVSLWLIFHTREASTSARWVRVAEETLCSDARFAAGTDANFAELNRVRPQTEETALPCFSINPQVHAFDDASLIENLGAQAAVVASTRQFAPRPVVVSPITLRPRGEAVDARQRSLFAAAWTTGSLARLGSLDGVHSLTYFETTGGRGVMDTAADSPLPGGLPSLPGGVFPLFHVFAAFAEGESLRPTRSTHPLLLDGFCTIGGDGRRRWAIANLTITPRLVRVMAGGSAASVRILDETNAAHALRAPEAVVDAITHRTPSGWLELELNAYAFAQITIKP